MKYKIGILISGLILFSVIYLVATSLREDRLNDIDHIKNNPSRTIKGLVIDKHTYKGSTITVRYKSRSVFL